MSEQSVSSLIDTNSLLTFMFEDYPDVVNVPQLEELDQDDLQQADVIPSNSDKEIAPDVLHEIDGEAAAPTETTLFADYMLEWPEIVRPSIELITYISYSNAVKVRIVPYFRETGVTLEELQAKGYSGLL